MSSITVVLSIKQDGQIWDLNDLPDGFVIKGDLDLSGKGLEKLPDLSKVTIEGNFSCSGNKLTSLEGAPKEVGGNFDCSRNQLTSLKGAPEKVGGDFSCFENQLTSLEGAPKEVGGDFSCYINRLTSLEGAPEKVGGHFNCSDNQLTSLEGAPKEVGGDFDCFRNKLTSLKGAPEKVSGYFYCYHNQLTSLEGAPEKVGGAFDCSDNQLTSLKGAPKEVSGYFRSDVDIAEKYGLGKDFTFDDLKASELYIKETKQEMIDKKAQELKYKLLREFAKENVSPEKGVVNPKRTLEEKKKIGLILNQITNNNNK